MAWDSTSIKNSLYSMLGLDSTRADVGRAHQLEQVRMAMLACLEGLDDNEVPALLWRIRYAKDVQTLWYLRSDLMGVLASRQGEAIARDQLCDITQLFRGLVPKGLMSRSSRLC